MKRSDVLLTGLTVLLLTASLSLSSFAQDARLIAKKAFPSVVLLALDDAKGQPLSLGSGFFVSPDAVVTNMHVVEGASRGFAKIVGSENKYNIVGLVAADHNSDLVLLKVSGPPAPSLALGDSEIVEVGQEVYVVGNPAGLEGTFSQGIVSGIRKLENDTLLQITAPISPGSSGGPVLNSQGQVIGVAVASFRSGQNLNFAIPVSYLKKLLNRAEHVQVTPLGSASVRTASSFVGAQGERSIEGVVIRYFKWEGYGRYGFTVQNQLPQPVREIEILVMFLAEDGGIVHAERKTCPDVMRFPQNTAVTVPVEPGMGHRCQFSAHGSVIELTRRVEFRVLSFKIAKQ